MVADMADPADTQRLIGDLAREAVVSSVDLANGTCRVKTGEIETGDIPWLATRAGSTRLWSPPSVGEQVLVLCPEGDTEAAIVAGSLSSDQHPHAGSDGATILAFEDGTTLRYDPAAHALEATLGSGGTATIIAEGGITLRGDVKIEGDVRIEGAVDLQGKMTAADDVVAAGKSLKGHKHTGVQAGGGISGAPQ